MSVETERAVVASLLWLPSLAKTCNLCADDFEVPLYGKVYGAIKSKGAICDNEFKDLLGVGVTELDMIRDAFVTHCNFEYDCKRIRKERITRLIQDGVEESLKTNDKAEAGRILKEVSDLVSHGYGLLDGTTEIKTFRDIVAAGIAKIDAMKANPDKCVGISTGFKKLNSAFQGWQPGEHYIVAGRPAMGKTAFALQAIINAMRSGKRSLLISLEMFDWQLFTRIVANCLHMDHYKVRNAFTSTQDRDEMEMFLGNDYLGNVFFADQTQVKNESYLSAAIEKNITKNKIEMVVLDYLQLLPHSSRAMSREQQVSGISAILKNSAKEYMIPIITLSQLNRDCEKREDKRPMLSDLRESGSIEQDADVVMLLYRDEVYNENTKDKDILEINIAKNRNGISTCEKVLYNRDTQVIRDLQ